MINGTQSLANVVTAAVKTGDQNLGVGKNLTYEQNFNNVVNSGQQVNSNIGGFSLALFKSGNAYRNKNIKQTQRL